MITLQNWKRKIATSSMALMLIGGIGGTQIAAAGGLNDTGLDTLGITEAQYDAARDDAKAAYNEEMIDLGWVTEEEAAEATAEDKWVKIGRGQYYQGILDKDAFVADALGISEVALDSAEQASYDAKIAERVAEGDMTAEEAANKVAIHDFKDGIDDDSVLAQALGISVNDLNTARAANTSYEDLLTNLGLTNDDVRANTTAIKEQLVADAIADGTLTEEQGASVLEGRSGRRGRGGDGQAAPVDAEAQLGRGARARQNPEAGQNPVAGQDDAQPVNEAPVGTYDS